MGLKYKIKRRWIKFILWKRKKFTKGYEPNDEQKKAMIITKRLIIDPQSELHSSANNDYGSKYKSRYIIRNGHLFIRITHSSIRIINGTYKYDVPFEEANKGLSEVKDFFAKNVERRLDKYEDEINDRVHKSLDTIIEDTRNK